MRAPLHSRFALLVAISIAARAAHASPEAGMDPDDAGAVTCAAPAGERCVGRPATESTPSGDLDVTFPFCGSGFVLSDVLPTTLHTSGGSVIDGYLPQLWSIPLADPSTGASLGTPSAIALPSIAGTPYSVPTAVSATTHSLALIVGGAGSVPTDSLQLVEGAPGALALLPRATVPPAAPTAADVDCDAAGNCLFVTHGYGTSTIDLLARYSSGEGTVVQPSWITAATALASHLTPPALGRPAVLADPRASGAFFVASFNGNTGGSVWLGQFPSTGPGVTLNTATLGVTPASAERRIAMATDASSGLWLAFDSINALGTGPGVDLAHCDLRSAALSCAARRVTFVFSGTAPLSSLHPALTFDGLRLWLAFEGPGDTVFVGTFNPEGTAPWSFGPTLFGRHAPVLASDRRGTVLLATRDSAQSYARLLQYECASDVDLPVGWRCVRGNVVGPAGSCATGPEAGPEPALDAGPSADVAGDLVSALDAPERDAGPDARADSLDGAPDASLPRDSLADGATAQRPPGHAFAGGACQCSAPGSPAAPTSPAAPLALLGLVVAVCRRRERVNGRVRA